MAALAFKALSYGAEQIPDKFFERVPGGFFTPAEQRERDKERKERKAKESRHRYRSEDRSSRRNSRRALSPPTEYSDNTDDSDYERERERRKKERRRAKSAGKTSSRSLSRGRRHRHSSDLDGQHSDGQELIMAQPEQGQPYFPPPPTSEYKPYNPQEYASSPVTVQVPIQEHRPSQTPTYGYPPQVNILSSVRRSTLATMPEHPTPASTCPPMLRSRTTSSASSAFPFKPRLLDTLSRGSPVSAAFTPSYEPPLAALLQRPLTNTPKPAPSPPRGVSLDYGQHDAPRGPVGYAPSPVYAGTAPPPVVNAPIPPPPVGSNSPMNPYHHVEFPASGAGYQPSPPPFTRQRSNSQPTFAPVPSAIYPTYTPPVAREEVVTYNQPPVEPRGQRRRAGHVHKHRARSADSHSHQSRSSRDHGRDDSRMTKMRDRFDGMDLREKALAASVGGTGLRARSRSIIDRFRSKSHGGEDRDSRRDDKRDRRPDRGYDYGRDDYDYFSSDSEGNGSPVKTRRHRKRDY
ncbi:hypothetical protein TW65_08252 [Stemphylium lycopersici]|uniref:Uncharacterized protein n=1 Tax=Stemphylium lycopersici TaxID=183478 RepID=A0A364NG96_STELY|nr:hypothetical protein TW65_08252 [Stemphylium lycopersici]RAR16354.1 hypothetical protein DDE83_000227 [Stemphylium lycopersici]